ncbi:MAG: hypothetical protein EZS28_005560 [Streblomastix strix]|uniref:Rhodanese domain-containing protein n=1 Tax=Streblomastix strix TaxID=222440 RepID=A0A5J4WVQ8_9EUKA|nr:MAG: hypothetical protein EZS28_005560 [Streblomastix strix]
MLANAQAKQKLLYPSSILTSAISAQQFSEIFQSDFLRRWLVIFDVRNRADFFETHVFGAFNIDIGSINAQAMLKFRETYDYICCIYDDGLGKSAILLAGILAKLRIFSTLLVIRGGYQALHEIAPQICYVKVSRLRTRMKSLRRRDSFSTLPLADTEYPAQIMQFLYIGSAAHASNIDILDQLNIGLLVNCAAEIDIPPTELSENENSSNYKNSPLFIFNQKKD